MNRLDRAEYLIIKYTEEFFIDLGTLFSDGVDLALNMPHHRMHRDELIVLIYRMFQDHCLVASRNSDTGGLFTPSLDEIERAIISINHRPHEDTIYFGLTSSGLVRMRELAPQFNDDDQGH